MVRTAKKSTGICGVPTTKKPTAKSGVPADDVSSVCGSLSVRVRKINERESEKKRKEIIIFYC